MVPVNREDALAGPMADRGGARSLQIDFAESRRRRSGFLPAPGRRRAS